MRKHLAKEVRRSFPGTWKNKVQRVGKEEGGTEEGTNLSTMWEDHSNKEGSWRQILEEKGQQIVWITMLQIRNDVVICIPWDYSSWCHKERGCKVCLCVQGSSEASKRTHQGKTAGEKSEMGVTLEIIHELVTIEGRQNFQCNGSQTEVIITIHSSPRGWKRLH